MHNKRSLIIIGFAVMFGLSMTLPCDALNQQRDTKVEPGLSGVSIFDAASIETIINTKNSVSLEKVYIDEGILGGKPVSRSEHGPRQKLASVSTVAAIDTTKTSLEITQKSQNTPGVVADNDDPQSIIREVAISNGCSEAEIDLLMEIANRESSFRPDAISPNGNCVGLFQLDSNKGSKSQRLDPRYNTNRAIEYMRSTRYGSIQAAYDFRAKNGWY